ncbi:MAG: hypothetical protein QOD07_1039 [Frankiaceae bacterium]|jgi:hypothetical protein|nr:hypothetical protein [Frankiaceae bacterium]
MRTDATTPIPRCCTTHSDWAGLARHLVADFGGVPTKAIVDELSHAKRACQLFQLGNQDALDCAELIVRNRVLIATGRSPSVPATVAWRTAVANVA